MTTPTMHGFDVSHWNTVLPVAGLDDLIPDYPLMSGKFSEGATYRDPLRTNFWSLFRRNGARYRSGFHWIRSSSSNAKQVDNFLGVYRDLGELSKTGTLNKGVFLQLDWETTKGIPDCSVDQIEDWCDRVTRVVGPRLVVYASDWVPGFAQWRKRNPLVPLWYANYNQGDSATGGWAETRKYGADLWQFTSSYAVPGFASRVDGNMILNFATLEKVCGYAPSDGMLVIGGDPVPTTNVASPVVVKQQEYNDMSTLIQVQEPDGSVDPAIYALSGGLASWVSSTAELNVQYLLGTVPTNDPNRTVKVGRELLKCYVLVSSGPSYLDGYAGPRTSGADFRDVA